MSGWNFKFDCTILCLVVFNTLITDYFYQRFSRSCCLFHLKSFQVLQLIFLFVRLMGLTRGFGELGEKGHLFSWNWSEVENILRDLERNKKICFL